MQRIVIKAKGTTTGAISGKRYRYEHGDEFIAPIGEFSHLDPRDYEVLDDTTEVVTDFAPGVHTADLKPTNRSAKRRGAYYDLFDEGEKVGRVKGKKNADRFVEQGIIPSE